MVAFTNRFRTRFDTGTGELPAEVGLFLLGLTNDLVTRIVAHTEPGFSFHDVWSTRLVVSSVESLVRKMIHVRHHALCLRTCGVEGLL
jgi:hypothetical protein